MTRFLDQTILRRGTARVSPPSRASARVPPDVDREITLRDYGRVLWSGRWLILASTVVAALVGLILTFADDDQLHRRPPRSTWARPPRSRARRCPRPSTNPRHRADRAHRRPPGDPGGRGSSASRPAGCARPWTLTAPRAPGGAVGNQPTIATITFTGRDPRPGPARRERVRRGRARAVARVVSAEVVQHLRAGRGPAARPEVARLQDEIEGYRRQLRPEPGRRPRPDAAVAALSAQASSRSPRPTWPTSS